MTLDEQVLAEAREVRQRLVDLESQTAHARVDYHHAIKKLHAAGGSLREIADVLELSHQRVHQIVEGPAGMPGGPPWARGRWRHGGHRGRGRQHFFARFDQDAREVMGEAQQEASALRHGYIGTEHLMLALAKRGIEGVSYDAARTQVVERLGEGEQPWVAGISPAAKRVMAHAVEAATAAGREQFAPGDMLLALVQDPRGTGGEILRDLGVTPELRGTPAR
jgi:hypothetical protein